MTLDRAQAWRSFSSAVKLKITVGDTSASAPGHLIYGGGEQYDIGFKQPYDRLLGTFFITPSQVIYWDVNRSPRSFSNSDSFHMSDLVPINLPAWNPRDLMPFPISARTGGFQTDSIWFVGHSARASGSCDAVSSELVLGGPHGAVSREIVRRAGCEPVIKEYWRFRNIKGWPVATRVSCSNESGTVKLSWVLGGIELDADPIQPEKYLSQSSKSETTP
jgi:hypothetical protein